MAPPHTPTNLAKRHTLARLGALGAGTLLTGAISTTTRPASAAGTSCAVVPDETAGPFPADGSTMAFGPGAGGQAYNVLALPGMQRADIRTRLDGTGREDGVPMTLVITLANARKGCAPLAGHAIYVWHCARNGDYSVYSTGRLQDNQLRGVQVSDAAGQVRFTTIVPGCYMGRMPHVHLEVYTSAAQAVHGRHAVKTTQLAFPTETMAGIYAQASGYGPSAANLKRMSFDRDMVFADGVTLEMVTLTGSPAKGFEAAIQLAIG
jgi:protocatechuate 3,4-dioxygenase beta subunit